MKAKDHAVVWRAVADSLDSAPRIPFSESRVFDAQVADIARKISDAYYAFAIQDDQNRMNAMKEALGRANHE